jgi:hypothetical protein
MSYSWARWGGSSSQGWRTAGFSPHVALRQPCHKKKKIWTRGGTPSPPGSTPAAAAAVAPRAPPPSPPLPPPPPPPPPKKKGGEGERGGRGKGGGRGRGGGKGEGGEKNLPDKTKVKSVWTGTCLPGQIVCVQRDFVQRCDDSFVTGKDIWQWSFRVDSLVPQPAHLERKSM